MSPQVSKVFAALAALVVLAALAFGVAQRSAVADPIVPSAPSAAPGGVATMTGAVVTNRDPHGDRVHSNGTGMALVFWLFAGVTVGGAFFVVTRKNLIAAVMGMVGSFMGISAVYMLLYASFLAVVQMLVYAGAIMVLFVFVVMILNRPEDHPIGNTGKAGKGLGIAAILYLLGRIAFILIKVTPPTNAAAAPGATVEGHDWGSTKALGTELFTGYLFPFEAISILLLIAVVGAIAIARPLKDDEATAIGADPGIQPTGGGH